MALHAHATCRETQGSCKNKEPLQMKYCLLAALAGMCIAETHMVFLEPHEDLIVFERVEEDGLQFTLRVDPNNQADVAFRVYEPHEMHDREETSPKDFGQFSMRKDYVYDKKGLYGIQITNLDQKVAWVTIKSTVDKLYTADDNFAELRRGMNVLENELGSLDSGNRWVDDLKRAHLREARRMLKVLVLLCVLPLGYVAIGFLKLRRMKMFFMPKH
eukprot:jgi/Antlo1/1395/1238